MNPHRTLLRRRKEPNLTRKVSSRCRKLSTEWRPLARLQDPTKLLRLRSPLLIELDGGALHLVSRPLRVRPLLLASLSGYPLPRSNGKGFG